MSGTLQSPTLLATECLELDRYVEAFEQAHARHANPDISDFLPPDDHPLYLTVLRELTCVDLEFRWESGRPRHLEDYRSRIPRLFESPIHLAPVAQQEFRWRLAAGEQPSPDEYRKRYGIEIADESVRSGIQNSDVGQSFVRPRTPSDASGDVSDVRSLLHRRLRYIGIAAVGVFAYFAILGLINPNQKMGLFLDHTGIVAVNWIVLIASILLTAVLWKKRNLRLRQVRLIEIALFGMAILEMSLGLVSDLFFDRELVQPLREGDHALFHYASSWSLPFFALIVAYGTLVPSSWRRCLAIVGAMAISPIAISCAAGAYENALTQSFFQSYVLQVVAWMTGAIAIAAYGAHRLELLRHEAFEARRLGQYVLKRRIGSGGMGEVYLAEHSLLRRPCAIKVIRPEMAHDRQSMERFQLEVQTTATLTHPNTIQIFDYGETSEGDFYYVMEYLPGVDLKHLVDSEGPMAPSRVVHVLRQVCGALAEAHSVGLVHRDVKPRNVILCERGGMRDVAKLLDFGLVYAAGVTSGISESDVLVGTPEYMSPEQASGRGTVDARSDIYSLGAVGYFLLTGRAPFESGSLLDTLNAQQSEAILPPSQLSKNLPPELEAIVIRCLEKDPARRFQSASEMEESLTRCERVGKE